MILNNILTDDAIPTLTILCILYTQAKRGARSMADVRVAVRDNRRPLLVQDRFGTVHDIHGNERRAVG